MKKKFYVVVVNSDLTEGRGKAIPLAICELYTTALRMAAGADVQGSDGHIEEIELDMGPLYGSKCYYGPVEIVKPTQSDIIADRQRQGEIERKAKRQLIVDKCRSLGLSDDELSLLES